MKDRWHSISKWIDHNRGQATGWVAAAGLAGAVALLGGCEALDGRVVSSQTGQVVDADQREVEYNARIRELSEVVQTSQRKIAEAGRDIDMAVAAADAADADLQRDLERIEAEIQERNRIITLGANALTDQVPTALPFVNLVLGAFGIGATAVATGTRYDNRRKDRVIEEVKKAKA